VGWKRIVIHPRIGGGLTNASYRLKTLRGTAASAWKVEGGTTTLDCTVPVGSEATVVLPATDAARVTEGGKPLATAPGIKLQGAVDGRVAVTVESGTYRFVCGK
jgi:alpha-L-rhamnosidase